MVDHTKIFGIIFFARYIEECLKKNLYVLLRSTIDFVFESILNEFFQSTFSGNVHLSRFSFLLRITKSELQSLRLELDPLDFFEFENAFHENIIEKLGYDC